MVITLFYSISFLIPLRAYRTLLLPLLLCSLKWSEELEAATLFSVWIRTHYCTRHRAVLVYVHTHTKPMSQFWGASRVLEKQTPKLFSLSLVVHACFLMQPSKGTFYHFDPVCFSERKAHEFRGKSFMLTGRILPVFPFYSQSLRGLEAPRIHSHHQMTWENNAHFRTG